jgi:hypothetical protein
MTKGAAWVSVIVGIWLAAAPFSAGYHALNRVATTNGVITGILMIIFALWLAVGHEGRSVAGYLLGLTGLWAIAAPYSLSYRTLAAAFNTDVIGGIIVLIAAIIAIYGLSHGGSSNLHARPA